MMDTLLAAQEHDEEEGATGPLRDGDITAASVDLIMAGQSIAVSMPIVMSMDTAMSRGVGSIFSWGGGKSVDMPI